MIYPSADLLENWGSKYSLVVLAAKRAKQIKSGAPPLVETNSRNPLTIALEEIAAGKIYCQVADHDILPKTTQEAEVAQLLAIPTLPLDEEAAAEEPEAIAVFSDETELVSDEEDEVAEEEDEEAEPLDVVIKHEEEGIVREPGFDEELEEEEEAEHLVEVESEIEPEVLVVEPKSIAKEPPKPKTRAAKKKEPEAEAVIEPEPLAVEPEPAAEEPPKPKTRGRKSKEADALPPDAAGVSGGEETKR